jgi:hypothetical protein
MAKDLAESDSSVTSWSFDTMRYILKTNEAKNHVLGLRQTGALVDGHAPHCLAKNGRVFCGQRAKQEGLKKIQPLHFVSDAFFESNSIHIP